MLARISGKNINYQIKGDGKPLILVHGWGGTSESLRAVYSLTSKVYESIILDLPGFGKSDLPDRDWGVEEYSKLIVKFINFLKLKKVSYFGHSFGGSLGIYIASQYPEVIDSLILCAASYKRQNKSSRLAKLFAKTPKIVKKFAYRIFFPGSDLFKYANLEANFRKIVVNDLTPQLVKIKQPTLIFWGKQDRETPIELAYELKNKIKNSQLILFPNEGHNLPLIHPELISGEIAKFIKS